MVYVEPGPETADGRQGVGNSSQACARAYSSTVVHAQQTERLSQTW
jgi:hypothetical protein